MFRRREGTRKPFGRRWRLVLTSLGCALVSAAASADPDPLYTNNPRFRIPFQFDAAEMTRIGAVEVQLHVSTDRGNNWNVSEAVSPAAQKFTFQAPGDGDYWFSVRTIDLQGKSHPGGSLAPGLRVIVDETDPVLTLSVAEVAPGRVQLNWQAVDEHLDPGSLRLEYLDERSGAWQPLNVQSGKTGSVDWSVPQAGTALVRGSISDLAGNSVEASGSARVSQAPSPGLPAGNDSRQERPDLREPVAQSGVNQSPFASTQAAAANLPVILPNMPHAPVPLFASSSQTIPGAAESVSGLPTYSGQEGPPPAAAVGTTVPQGVASALPPMAGPLDNARRVNSRSFRIGYELQEVGPSGVGSVDLYISEDSGRRWFHYGADPDRANPFDVIVPRDGVYGFAIRVRNGIGVVANPPQPGEPPEIVVVVDQTAPLARLTAIQQVSVNGTHQVQVSWFAQDDFLASRPIALYEGLSATGPWTPITGWIENSGQYLWSFQPSAPRSVFLRLEVRDAAGNINAAVSDRPLLLDTSRPTARILDVESVQPAGSIR